MNNITFYTLMILGAYITFTLFCNVLSVILEQLLYSRKEKQHDQKSKNL